MKPESGDREKGLSWRSRRAVVIVASVAILAYIAWPLSTTEAISTTSATLGASDGTSVGAVTASEADLAVDPRLLDPARELVDRISKQTFGVASEVATGRFLRQFEEGTLVLKGVDLRRARPVTRGHTWLYVEAPFAPVVEHHGDRMQFPWEGQDGPERVARLRLVECDGDWKIEEVRVIGES